MPLRSNLFLLWWACAALVACAIPSTLGAMSIASPWGYLAMMSAAGIAVGLMLCAPRAAWLPIALGAAGASAVSSLATPHPVIVRDVLLSAAAVPVLLLVTAWSIRRVCGDALELNRPRYTALMLAMLAIVGGGLSIAIDLLLARLIFGSFALASPWVIVWIRHTVCLLIVVPAILSLAEIIRHGAKRPPRQLVIRGLLVGLTIAATLQVFTGEPDDWRAFALLLFPVAAVVATALLSGPRLVALNALLMGIGAIGLTGEGQGPIAALLTRGDAVVAVDLFVICTSVLGLLSGAAVADRARLAAEVGKARERLELAVMGSHVGIWDWDVLTGHIHWAAAPENTDTPDWPADIVTWENSLHPDDRVRVRQVLDAHLRDGTPYNVDYRMRLGGDDYPWFRARGAAIRDDSGRAVRMLGTLVDVTEELAASRRLVESEERFRELAEMTDDFIVRTDIEGRRTYRSPSVLRTFGFSPEELNDTSATLRVHPDDHHKVAALRHGATDDKALRVQFRAKVADGSWIWVDIQSRPVFDAQGRQYGWVSYGRDITSLKDAQNRLRQAEAELRTVFEVAPVGIAKIDPSGRLVMVNPALCRILGRTEAELLSGLTYLDVTPPEDRAMDEQLRERAIAGGQTHYGTRKRYLRPDGKVVWADVSAAIIRDGDGKLVYQVTAVSDITDRVQAGEALAASEQQYRRLVEGLNVVAWEADPATFRFTFVSGAAESILGYAPDEWLAPNFWTRIVHPDDLEAAKAFCTAKTCDGEDHEFEYRAVHKSGRIVWLRDLVSVSCEPGGVIRLSGVLIDITRQREAEAALQQSERRFRGLIETAEEGVWLVDAQWRTTFVNRRLADMLGHTPEAMRGRHIHEFMDAAARELSMSHMRDRELGQSAHHDFRLKHADGRDVWVLISTNPIVDDRGGFIGAMAMLTDITQRRQDEQALRESERTNRAILAAMPDVMFVMDAQGRYVDYHAQNEANLLVRPQEFLGKTPTEVLPRHLAAVYEQNHARLRATGQPQTYEYQTDRQGETRFWEVRMVLREDGCIISLVRNITERKRAELALADSQRRLAALVGQAPIGIIVWNTRFEIMQWNPAAEKIFGYTSAEAVGKHGSLIVPAEARQAVEEVWRAVVTGRGGKHSINENLTSAGSRIVCEWHNTTLIGADGTTIGVSSFVQDVSERVSAERRQHLLMQELDHRVKNNMAAVLSLAEQTGRAAGSLEEFQATFAGRVRTLARMHNVLAANRWRDANLLALVCQTVTAYAGDSPDRLQLTGPDAAVPARAAQSLAISLNELATNAAKHGALSSARGRVEVRWDIQPVEGGPSLLRMNWVERGGPLTSPPTRRGLGIDLIEGAIIYQLGGEVAFRFDPEGLECDLSVPLKEDESASLRGGPDNQPRSTERTQPLPR